MIPKKIHYCWFGGKPLPMDVKKYIKTWKKYCPDYEVIEWNESNVDINSHPFMKSAYEKKAWAFVSDYARLKVVYDNGGIYLDTDVELVRNMDFLLNNAFYIGVQQEGRICTTGLGFGAEKNNPIVKKMLNKYDDVIYDENRVKELACPYLNNSVVLEMGYEISDNIWKTDEITVYPSKYFDPISPGQTSNLMCDETVSIHNYSASWAKGKTRWKRKIVNLIGTKRIDKLKKVIKQK